MNVLHVPLRFAVEAESKALSSLLGRVCWTDIAMHELDRLPPYIKPLVRYDVEQYANDRKTCVVSWDLLNEARNRGTVTWDSEAEQRLVKVPAGIRAMARVELERTAIGPWHVGSDGIINGRGQGTIFWNGAWVTKESESVCFIV